MLRPVMSYALTFLILLSQTGLPVHMHYCKGMLESVSVIFSAGCDDHDEIAKQISCCTKESKSHCSGSNKDCCDNEVKVLLQDFSSLLPHFDKWNTIVTITGSFLPHSIPQVETVNPELLFSNITDTGPPIYILFHSLIYYA